MEIKQVQKSDKEDTSRITPYLYVHSETGFNRIGFSGQNLALYVKY
ncbi:MAG: hypothetical protein FJ041_00100 [Candidatus Cloacimonetes bacterium]|nr:hypothetical protein [Candidatus Cloacimonadota bacterium]